MTHGLKHDATGECDTTELNGDNDTAATRSVNHMTPEHLILDLMERAAEQDGLKGSGNPPEEGNIQPRKPARTLIDRLITTPIRKVSTGLASAKMAILSYQPAPRHIALILMVTILLIAPWFVPSLLAFVLGTVAFIYLVIGYEYSAKLVTTWFKWLKRRDSRGAEVIRARAERVSSRLTRCLNLLPAKWTTGLYLPDFALTNDFSEKLKSDPFGRLTCEAQNR